MTDIGLVLLAAGSSERMGCAKQLLDYRGQPLVRRAAQIALASRCDAVFVVVGSQGERVLSALEGLPIETVIHTRWRDGIGSSIGAGIAAASQLGVAAAIVALADQIQLTAESYDRLIEAYRRSGRSIVASRYADTMGVPALFGRHLFHRLLALPPGAGCKPILRDLAADVLALDCPEAAVDIDTPEDYTAALATVKPSEEAAFLTRR